MVCTLYTVRDFDDGCKRSTESMVHFSVIKMDLVNGVGALQTARTG
jgi:hypothetical protein